MKLTYRICSILFLLFVVFGKGLVLCADNVVTTIQSPDGSMILELLQNEEKALFYRVNKDGTELIAKSALGIETSVGDFTTALETGETVFAQVDENYPLFSGKKSVCRNKYNEMKLPLTRDEKSMNLVIRMYDDGVAYRYELDGSGQLSVISELSECNPVGKERIYSQVYSADYKSIVEESDWGRESCLKHTSLPLLVQSGESYVMISEAGVDGSYAAAKLFTNDETHAFVYGITGGRVETVLPFRSPWRMMIIGSLEDIVNSDLPGNLNATTTLGDLSWIKPGRAAWSYGGDDTSGYLSEDRIYEYIDWAAEMGWEYFTLDRGWEEAEISLSNIISYASKKQVGLFVWVNQNKLPADDTSLRNRLLNWKNIGVKGIKVDFWEDDTQEMMMRYDQILRLAAEQKLLLDFHSCTKPVGWQRTWPHLLTTEAVLSNAYYAESPNIITAAHNTNSAIMRGSLGAVDYAPVDFASRNGKINNGTTWAHQLALSVVFESGLQHINDAPNNFRYHVAKGFLRNLPVAWDDSNCLEAVMDSAFTVARRKGNDWYVAALTTGAREWNVKLDFLDSDKTYNAYVYRDGTCSSDLQFEYKEGFRSTDDLSLQLLAYGGATVLLSPSADYDKPDFIKYEAESSDNLIPFGVAIRMDVDSLCSGNEYVASIGNGRSLTFRKVLVPQSGTYALTFYYTSAVSRFAYVKVNDKVETRKEYTFYSTGADTGSGLGMKTVLVELDAATENTIEFGCDMDYAPAVDRIELSWIDAGETSIDDVENDSEHGNVYTHDRQIIMEQSGETHYVLFNSMGQRLEAGSFTGGKWTIPVAEAGVYLLQMDVDGVFDAVKVLVK